MPRVVKAEVGQEVAFRPPLGPLALLDIEPAGARYGALEGLGDGIPPNSEHPASVSLFVLVPGKPCR